MLLQGVAPRHCSEHQKDEEKDIPGVGLQAGAAGFAGKEAGAAGLQTTGRQVQLQAQVDVEECVWAAQEAGGGGAHVHGAESAATGALSVCHLPKGHSSPPPLL